MSKIKKEERIAVTIHLQPSTIKRLEEITHYLTIRENRASSIERVIKAAIVDYLDIMKPTTEEEHLAEMICGI